MSPWGKSTHNTLKSYLFEKKCTLKCMVTTTEGWPGVSVIYSRHVWESVFNFVDISRNVLHVNVSELSYHLPLDQAK